MQPYSPAVLLLNEFVELLCNLFFTEAIFWRSPGLFILEGLQKVITTVPLNEHDVAISILFQRDQHIIPMSAQVTVFYSVPV